MLSNELQCSFELEFLVKFSLSLLFLNKMEFEKFLDFIYFSSFTLSVNFPDQLVTDMSKPILKS